VLLLLLLLLPHDDDHLPARTHAALWSVKVLGSLPSIGAGVPCHCQTDRPLAM